MRMRCGDLQVGYFDLRLRYELATIADAETADVDGVVQDSQTEVPYHEIDVIDDGWFEHRLLFWPQGEFVIRFEELQLAPSPVNDRQDP